MLSRDSYGDERERDIDGRCCSWLLQLSVGRAGPGRAGRTGPGGPAVAKADWAGPAGRAGPGGQKHKLVAVNKRMLENIMIQRCQLIAISSDARMDPPGCWPEIGVRLIGPVASPKH